MDYSAQHFIDKFENIPEDQWTTDTYLDNTGRRCALGFCNYSIFNVSDEGEALCDLFRQTLKIKSVVCINDGDNANYPQPTPKLRILAALYDIKAMEAVKQANEIISQPSFQTA